MSIENTVPLNQVEPDIDPIEIGTIKNPLKTNFTHDYDGKPQTLKAGESKTMPLYLCVHLAKHLAEKIIRAEFRAGIAEIEDEKLRADESRKSIPNQKHRIWVQMKKLVVTDSDFFKDKPKDGEKSNEEKFMK